jgi:hypothetical protein
MKGAGLHTVHTVDDMHSSGQSRLRITQLWNNIGIDEADNV